MKKGRDAGFSSKSSGNAGSGPPFQTLCTAASNKLRENKSNFFPALYPSIKIKIVNETHIETQSQ